jgi:hypothetical protein
MTDTELRLRRSICRKLRNRGLRVRQVSKVYLVGRARGGCGTWMGISEPKTPSDGDRPRAARPRLHQLRHTSSTCTSYRVTPDAWGVSTALRRIDFLLYVNPIQWLPKRSIFPSHYPSYLQPEQHECRP